MIKVDTNVLMESAALMNMCGARLQEVKAGMESAASRLADTSKSLDPEVAAIKKQWTQLNQEIELLEQMAQLLRRISESYEKCEKQSATEVIMPNLKDALDRVFRDKLAKLPHGHINMTINKVIMPLLK